MAEKNGGRGRCKRCKRWEEGTADFHRGTQMEKKEDWILGDWR